jgi:hypothetical protein
MHIGFLSGEKPFSGGQDLTFFAKLGWHRYILSWADPYYASVLPKIPRFVPENQKYCWKA